MCAAPSPAPRAPVGVDRDAHGGTLLLDEVGEMSLTMQVKLLDVLESKRVRPAGGSEEVPVDVRFIAATNKDLAKAVADGGSGGPLYLST